MAEREGMGGLPEPRLELVTTAHVLLAAPLEVGDVLLGRRRVIGIAGGRLDGPLLSGDILAGGADTQTVADDGTAVIDTRYLARTDAGHVLTIATQGFRHGPPEVLDRLAAGEHVDPSEYTFRVTARLECGAGDLSWVNRTIFVAAAARAADAVRYRLYAVA